MVFVNLPVTVTLTWLEVARGSFEEDGVAWNAPKCDTCKNELQIGDRVDHLWPYYDDKNLCCACAGKAKPCR